MSVADAEDSDAPENVRVAPRVRRVSARDTEFGQGADFECAYEVDIAPEDDRCAGEWAREAWEGASAPLRWFMLAGWRLVLGLHLGRRSSPDHILGWQVAQQDFDKTVCQAASRFLHATNRFERIEGRLVWSTYVTYDRRIAHVIWPPVSLLHRPLVRIALRRAALHN